ncbi:MAG: hypothetical protein ACHQC8_02560 [Solirubrobacterales bacterium]
MSFQFFSQRDPQWKDHLLGTGPSRATIGPYGCNEVCDSMIAWNTGHQLNPAQLDDLYVAKGLFGSSGGGDFTLVDRDALARAFEGEYTEWYVAGYDEAAVVAAVADPNTYVKFWIVNPAIGVPTHFVIAGDGSGSTRRLADPWTGGVSSLQGYGGTAAVAGMIFVRHHPLAPPLPAPTPTPPIPAPAPVPEELYSFYTADDTHPPDGAMTRATAFQLADEWYAAHGSVTHPISVYQGDVTTGQIVYELPGGDPRPT